MLCPDPKSIESAVTARYAELAGCGGSLSCGSALDLAAPVAGEVLVDLGSGRGKDVLLAALRVGPGGKAVGIDCTDAMVEAARAAVPANLTNVRFLRCDLAQLELADGFADAVTSNCAINHAADKAAVFREVFRVLRPGGRLVVSDITAERELPESVRSDPAAWAACYGGAIPEGEYLEAVRAGGFGAIEVLSRSEPYQKAGVLLRRLTFRAGKPQPKRFRP